MRVGGRILRSLFFDSGPEGKSASSLNCTVGAWANAAAAAGVGTDRRAAISPEAAAFFCVSGIGATGVVVLSTGTDADDEEGPPTVMRPCAPVTGLRRRLERRR